MVAATLGFTLLAPHGASSTSAADRQSRVERPATADRFDPAVRQSSVRVGDPLTPPASFLEDYALEVVRLTNIERAAAGVPPVAVHPSVMVAAAVHAHDIAGKACRYGILSHTGSDGSTAGDRIVRTGFTSFIRWGENIGCAHKTPEDIVAGWMRSSGHQQNLLDPVWTHIGVSVVAAENGTLFWVQNFVEVA